MKILIMAALLLSTGAAYADGHGHRGGGNDWIFPSILFGSILGYELARPPYVYHPEPYPYVYPTVYQVTPAIAAVAAEPVKAPATYVYYYCEAEKGYYPYVPVCPGGWKNVPATPSQ